MRTRKTRKINRKKGGKELGRGRYGYTYNPPLKCTRSEKQNNANASRISKIFTREDNSDDGLYKEYANGLLVKELDPTGEWSITPELMCPLDKAQTNTNFKRLNTSKFKQQIIYKYGGVTLGSILKKVGEWDPYNSEGPDTRKYDVQSFKLYISLVKTLLHILPRLHVKYIHDDLHDNNILFNPDDGKLRIIDFGRLEPLNLTVRKLKHASKNAEQKSEETYIDLAKQIDYKHVYDNISSLIWSFTDTESLPGLFDSWYKDWSGPDGAVWNSQYDKTITCKIYIDAINAIP
jgi:serine/threonine protein kinase